MPKTLDERIAEIEKETVERIAGIRRTTDAKINQMRERDKARATADKAKIDLRTRLEDENGMADHPKRDLLWSKAWELGHSDGLHQVVFWYEDLVELAR